MPFIHEIQSCKICRYQRYDTQNSSWTNQIPEIFVRIQTFPEITYKRNLISNHKQSTDLVALLIKILLTFPSLTNSRLEKFENTKDKMPQNIIFIRHLFLSNLCQRSIWQQNYFEKPKSHLVYFVGIIQEVLKKSSSRWL